MLNESQVEAGKEIQQRTGKTFYFATRLLPERVRHATYVLYAFFRVADEVVDAEETAPPEQQRERLERLRAEALGDVETGDPVLSAFAELREQYDIDPDDVNVFIDAMESDIHKDRHATYEELETYMDGSASAVGRMMTAVMRPDDPKQALPHATALGQAFQLSNFLRDVGEDVVERDRVYLPETTLERHGVDVAQILDLEFDDRVAEVMRDELRRAESLYRDGVAGIEYLPHDCQFPVLLSAVLYADHHRSIRKLGYDTLSTTPDLSFGRKVFLLGKTAAYWAVWRDPVAVFKAVSVVPYPEDEEFDADFGPGSTPVGKVRSRGRVSGWIRALSRWGSD
ncbi:phytoene/squalene synthase family protein [Haloferax mediterranei ATCC 33500]|uniref:Geranylgeranyl-diphosphate geranylgeranyltransferase n=1 Tax=Haloferax mediterranei (strain ATCC 33500 / DSM 1411 / JCM 8866 / NBRC 14739 / NCIMB 2177 / R-4) TaxID=523841 RepID=I3R7L8_HALMT|nr:phytoene/squalene synthase family protein [Haloferax mediterranei]AFK20228.1 geranylgeranyl-diphosphate geranylgeranyltransferase (phytoene synthase) [Haloferax mediterranei ATCC 33500]AHZ23599.1 geranylgeranyl-diphosphate geranylgeranyltransferase [Haloferax mediterranei ATCC 33500]ELZ99083.1 geranylgeranyl-diphosphate geranylgeranyltransferase [Haloferax mediterranei ATCC 33500]MDX5987020.1 phytoene/squalene synthase family protein [Haloferax mediterranei ATCC 33500]QCQ76337.1 phytoene/sq